MKFAFLAFAVLAAAGWFGEPHREAQASGSLTWPVTSSVQVISWFDHDRPGPGLKSATYLPFIRRDGYQDATTDSLCTSANTCPCTDGVNCYNGHEGIDISTGGSTGQPIVAAASGVVTGTPGDTGDGFGRKVRLWHTITGFSTVYAHLDSWTVQENQFVYRGQVLGYSGCTGTCYGAHLHFGVYNAQSGGTPVDPYGWSGAGSDPWVADVGYLWSTSPKGNFDGATDRAVWRPSSGVWWTQYATGGQDPVTWGQYLDIPVPGDYDGDAKVDRATFRPSSGTWYLLFSSGGQGSLVWGSNIDMPLPADYDRDGQDDKAYWRPSTGVWYVKFANGTQTTMTWGQAGDVPVPADYDGDGRADWAYWRPSDLKWHIKYQTGSTSTIAFGATGDKPVPADIDGDGRDDKVCWRPSTGWWYVLFANGTQTSALYGTNGDIPLPADYDGDLRADWAVWRPSNGTWYIKYQTGNEISAAWGLSGDKVVPADYDHK